MTVQTDEEAFAADIAELQPPFDLAAEAGCISAVCLDPGRLATVSFLKAPHFHSEAHRQIWQAILDLRGDGIAVDVLTVQSRLRDTKRLAQVGGAGYLTEVLDAAPFVSNLYAYGIKVFELWRLRQLIAVGQRVVARGYRDSIPNVQVFADDVVQAYVALARNNPAATADKNDVVLGRIVEKMAEASRLDADTSRTLTPGFTTSIRSLDQATLGMRRKQKITLMAESGRGKTTLALQIGMHVAGWRGIRQPLSPARAGVLFWSMEQTKEELGIKQLSHAARVDSRRIEAQGVKPTLTAEEWARITQVMPDLEQLPIIIDDRQTLTVDDVVSATKVACERSMAIDQVPIGLVIVDYVQKFKAPTRLERKQRDEQVAYATEQLQGLAKDCDLAVLELAQMNPPDPRESKTGKPYKWLAAQSKQIEREAYQVWCLWRRNGKDNKRDIGLAATKLRGGDEFDLELNFEPEFSCFLDPVYQGFMSYEDF